MPALAFGVASVGHAFPRVYVAVGDDAIDVHALAGHVDLGVSADVFAAPSLNAFLALGRDAWTAVQRRITDALADAPRIPTHELTMHIPVAVGDYVDMYAGIHHATNLGRIFRPDGEPLLPNWRRLPVGYHGRAGSLVVSGTDVERPNGQVLAGSGVRFGPSAQLDIELELAFVVGTPSERGQPVPVERFEDHVFGVLLLNDWSARDIQAFEYQPLGPFLGKSFATSVAPWVVPLDALAPFMVPGWVPRQDPEPAAYLRDTTPHIPAVRFEVLLTSQQMRDAGCAPVVVSTVALEEALYWSMPQQLAHATVNGASVRTGDVFATGTLSGPDPMTQAGSLIERTWRGECPLVLPTGETRAFLADGDEVTLRGWCGAGPDRVDLGEVTGVVRGGR